MFENLDFALMIDSYIIPWSIKITLALLVFVVGQYISRLIVRLVRNLMDKARVDAMLAGFISNILRFVLLLFVLVAALDQLGINTTSLVALLGAAGIAVGLALKDSLQNFASGVLIILFRPFSVGDWIEAAGIQGKVQKITIFSTVLLTGDNRIILVPNGQIYNGTIINYTSSTTRRVDMVFGISYGDDLKKAKKIIEDVIADDDRILKDPAPLVAVSSLGDSSVNFNVRPWVKTADYWDVFYALNENIKLAFDDNGISIPFPQMDVHIQKGE